jgi:hypothetical protein
MGVLKLPAKAAAKKKAPDAGAFLTTIDYQGQELFGRSKVYQSKTVS